MMKSGQEQRTQLILLLRASSQDFHIEFVKSLTDMKNSWISHKAKIISKLEHVIVVAPTV